MSFLFDHSVKRVRPLDSPEGQAGVQVVGVVPRWAVLDHYGPKAHAARDPEAALRCFLEALESS